MDHKCREGFDAILAWQKKHAVPMRRISKIMRPNDYNAHIMSHKFKEALHWYTDYPDDVKEGELDEPLEQFEV